MRRSSLVFFVLVFLVSACSSTEPTAPSPSTSASTPSNASTNKEDYPVFPDADAGADPAVSAEQGGKGFKGEGWETNTAFDFIGDPRALKGGMIRTYVLDFPGTMRMYGPEANTALNYTILGMTYESLLGLHPTTQEFVPGLATHWKIDPDKMTFRFRINPNARYSNGEPVTADDVVATWTLLTDRGLQSPMDYEVYNRFEKPVAESKYIVRVKSKTPRWINFYTIAGIALFPASALKTVDGAAYLKDYNFKFLPGSGPYMVTEADIDKGKSVTIRRRKDYWGEKARINVGMYNFDEFRNVVVRDQNLAFEMMKKGDLDFFYVNRARVWAQELDFPHIQNGLIQKRRVYNNAPGLIQGFALNTRKPPFDDIRLRKALTHLFNREQLIEKLMFNAYEPMNSYEAGSEYENPNNPKNEYNPQLALQLLAEAGWKERDKTGRLTKNGKPLQFELLYDSKTSETYITVYQEELRRVGITMNLRLVTPETQWKLIMERKFEMTEQAWGNTLLPDPETSFSSKLADVDSTNNITGLKDPRIDELIQKYNDTFDRKERVKVMQDLDFLVASQHHYILQWHAGYGRIIFWNRYGAPKGHFSRTGDYVGSVSTGPGIPQMWWFDPAKSAQVDQALKNPGMKLEVGPTDDRYWLDYGKPSGSSSNASGESTKPRSMQ